tara:strand:+ start:292 stop:453 length:162 start_codon:yes stop_codon:yes gene_type:complete
MTKLEAFECALRLAIAAPDQRRSDMASVLADEIANDLTDEEIKTVLEEIECIG